MKTTKYKIVEMPIDITVTEARLLTKEEAEALPKKLRQYSDFWWTSTAVTDYYFGTWRVYGYDNCLDDYSVDCENAVRPALVFESKDLKVGDKFFFANKGFKVIKEGLAFCTSDIGECAFRTDWKAEDANDYEKSDIKKYIDKWFKENIK